MILTKAHRAEVSMMAKGSIVARVLPLKCFLFLLPNTFNINALKMYYCIKELTRREYCYMNTPSLQYFMLLTSGG